MKTRFKVIGSSKDEDKHFDSLFEALKESDEIYETDENGTTITWIWRELPQKIWHIVNYRGRKEGKEAEDF